MCFLFDLCMCVCVCVFVIPDSDQSMFSHLVMNERVSVTDSGKSAPAMCASEVKRVQS